VSASADARTLAHRDLDLALAPLAVAALPEPRAAIVHAAFLDVGHVALSPVSIDAGSDAGAARVVATFFDARNEALAEDAVLAKLDPLPTHSATGSLFALDGAGLHEDHLGTRSAPGRSNEKKARENAESIGSSHAAAGRA
jgi:hypothetical protein